MQHGARAEDDNLSGDWSYVHHSFLAACAVRAIQACRMQTQAPAVALYLPVAIDVAENGDLSPIMRLMIPSVEVRHVACARFGRIGGQLHVRWDNEASGPAKALNFGGKCCE